MEKRLILCTLLVISSSICREAAHAEVLFDNEFVIDFDGSNWIIDADDDYLGNDIGLHFGASSGKAITFDNTNGWFSINDDIYVQGDVRFTGEIVDSDGNTGTPGEVLVADGAGKNLWGDSSSNLDVQAITSSVPVISYSDVVTHQGGISLQRYNNIFGGTILSLTSDPDYPDNPDATSEPTLFEAPTNIGDAYGNRMSGYIIPPQTGNYTFWVASDDNSELYLSSDLDPGNVSLIASVTGYTASREWDKYPSQQSSPIYLTAGQAYYIEALHVENYGDDNLAVGWELPDTTLDRPISGSYLAPNFTLTDTHAIDANTDVVTVDSSVGPLELDLPAYTGQTRRITIKRESTDTNEILIVPNGSELIDGQTSLSLTYGAKEAVELQTDGTNIYIVTKYEP